MELIKQMSVFSQDREKMSINSTQISEMSTQRDPIVTHTHIKTQFSCELQLATC